MSRGLAIDPASRWLEVPVAYVDVETTGTDPMVDRVVEIAAIVAIGDQELARRSWLIHPCMAIPAEATAVHGITNEMVAEAPRFRTVLDEFAELTAWAIPGSYNARFDRAFAAAEAMRCDVYADRVPFVLRAGVHWIDALVWARLLQRYRKGGKKLTTVAERLGIAPTQAHRAMGDAETLWRVMVALARDQRVPKTYGELLDQQKGHGLAQSLDFHEWLLRKKAEERAAIERAETQRAPAAQPNDMPPASVADVAAETPNLPEVA